MKRWSFNVRSWGPSQAAPLEENERVWKDHFFFVQRAHSRINQAAPWGRSSKLGMIMYMFE